MENDVDIDELLIRAMQSRTSPARLVGVLDPVVSSFDVDLFLQVCD